MANDIQRGLPALLGECWSLLERGAHDPASRLHDAVLATSRADGAPDARTVRIESVEAATRRIRFNTDVRSPKVSDLSATPQAVLVFFDGSNQIRARVAITIHRADAAARHSWETLPEEQRIHYRTTSPPGTPIGLAQAQARPPNTDAGWENYALVEAQVRSLDWLETATTVGRRAVFTWSEDGNVQGQWVVP